MTPVPAEQVAEATIALDAVQVLQGGAVVYWLEGRPDGSDVLVRWTPADGAHDVLPPGTNVASYVHEYGGAYYATDTDLWFCNDADQRICRPTEHGPVPVTPSSSPAGTVRYADMRPAPQGTGLWAVRERHDINRVTNDLVWIPAPTGEPRAVAGGWDFYSFQRPSPDGLWLALSCWNAPNMAWDGTTLFLAEILDDSGTLAEPVQIAGGPTESVFQPEWSPGNVLHFISDRTGWWNLYRWTGTAVEPVLQCDAELGVAQWEFGYSTYAFLDDAIAVLAQRGGAQTIELLHDGKTTPFDLPFTSIKPYLAGSGSALTTIASTPRQTPQTTLINTATGRHRPLAPPPTTTAQQASVPEPFTFSTRDGSTAHGVYHAPRDAEGPPPLIVKAHPGPTANTPLRLDWHTQYFVSRSYAVAEIDYRGSTGYGRPYRQALHSQWGVLDAHDCADAARHRTRRPRPRRHLGRQRRWLHRSPCPSHNRHLHRRQRTLPRHRPRHLERRRSQIPSPPRRHPHRSLAGGRTHLRRTLPPSPPEHIVRPVLILHGDDDPITPPAQSRALANALGSRARLLTFPGEGHVLRSPESIQEALTAELAFLASRLHPSR